MTFIFQYFKEIELPFHYIKVVDPYSHIINFSIDRWISDLL